MEQKDFNALYTSGFLLVFVLFLCFIFFFILTEVKSFMCMFTWIIHEATLCTF